MDSKYNNEYIQVRYAHLASTPTLNVGQNINKGQIIGRIGTSGSTTGGYVVMIEVLKSTNGQPCAVNGSNAVKINPMPLFHITANYTDYLTRPLAVTYIDNMQSQTVGQQGVIEDIAYWANRGLNPGEVYLRKETVKLASQLDKNVDNDNLESRGILTWNSSTHVATVRFNNRTATFSVAAGTARVVNNRLAVSQQKFWEAMIANSYSASEGGTWYANDIGVLSSTVHAMYIPKNEAQLLYNIMSSNLIDNSIVTLLANSGADVAAQELGKRVLARYGTNPQFGLLLFTIQVHIEAQQLGNSDYAREFLRAVESCGSNQFVCVKTSMVFSGSYLYLPIVSVHNGANFMDIYPYKGRFIKGVYEPWPAYIF